MGKTPGNSASQYGRPLIAAKRSAKVGGPRLGKGPGPIGLLAILLIAVPAAVLATHWPALSAQAMLIDDDEYLTDNVLVKNPGWESTRRFLTEVLEPSSVKGYYQPLSMISLMTDYALGGRVDNLRQFHRTSLGLHVANTALVIVLIYMLFGRVWLAGGVGLLFGVHPITVEPIPWVADRKTVLMAFFGLWCLILYVRYSRWGGWGLYTGCLVMYVLALLSKPTSTPLPLLMLVMDYWPLKRLSKKTVVEKIPLFIVCGIGSVITYISQTRTAGAAPPSELGAARILFTVCHNIIFYLYKIIRPINQSPDYGFPKPLGLSHPMVLAGVVGTCLLIPLLILSLRRTRALFAGGLFFFIAIFPTLGVVGFTVMIACDKFVYFPIVGLLMVLAAFLGWLSGPCRMGKPTKRQMMLAIVVLFVAAAEAAATRNYLKDWRNTLSLYERIVKVTPDSPQALNRWGHYLQLAGRTQEAEINYRRALEIIPDYVEAHNNLANLLQTQEKYDEATYHLHQALQTAPNNAGTHYNMANILCIQGKYELAISHYRQALQNCPKDAEVYNNMGATFAMMGRLEDAVSCFRKSLQIAPNNSSAGMNLKQVLEKQGLSPSGAPQLP